jgi:NAD(P)-dependent dehydrogenase (short-subunit alcohol dehydrogenase family)
LDISKERVMDLQGKNILITGASRGLGRALALRLAAGGARVVLVARGRAALEQAVAEVRAAGGQAWGIADDVGDPGAAERIAGQAAALAGPIDVAVQNASTLGPLPMPALLDLSPEALARVLEVNLLGPFRLSRRLLGPMLLRGEGAVVTISSDAAVEAYPGWGAYGASKAALDHLARTWAAELEGTGVRIIPVDPGEMDTAMHADALPDADPETLADPADVAEAIAQILRSAPSGHRLLAADFPAKVAS